MTEDEEFEALEQRLNVKPAQERVSLEQAARMALEALEHEAEVGNDDAYRAERDALRRALEQPAQQESMCIGWDTKTDTPIFARPQAREPQEPVECMCGICKLGKREPLTDEQIDHAAGLRGSYSASLGEWSFSPHELIEFARAIEAAHGIREKK